MRCEAKWDFSDTNTPTPNSPHLAGVRVPGSELEISKQSRELEKAACVRACSPEPEEIR